MDNKPSRFSLDNEKFVNDGIIRTFRDGKRYKNSEYFQLLPNALRVIFYYDDIEVMNPLGSKTGIHKIGAILHLKIFLKK